MPKAKPAKKGLRESVAEVKRKADEVAMNRMPSDFKKMHSRKKEKKSADTTRFVVGEVYAVDYDDHWSSSRVFRDDIDDETCRLWSVGRCIKNHDKFVILEHQVTATDHHPTNKRCDHHGILKAAILRVYHLRPERA